jgi:hypothetical protein
LPILLLLAAFAPALAAQTALTADQFEKTLPALHTMHDDRAARALAGLELTERASPERAARWEAQMPGTRSAQALMVLVDASSFLDLPGEEVPATPPPPMDTQKQMLARAADQVEAMLHKLPNFYARRSTAHFESATPQQLQEQQESLAYHQLATSGSEPLGNQPLASLKPAKIPHQELGPIDRTKPALGRLFFIRDEEQSVSYSNGNEVASAAPESNGGLQSPDLGLVTRGEFGPVLKMVLEDALQRGLSWSHWEQGAVGSLAVFRYDVPRDLSHYEIVSWEGAPPYFPAYHGELAIDPASGAIRRITIQSSGADERGESLESKILVEYAQVAIGGQMYDCPVHCIAISRSRKAGEANAAPGAAGAPTFLNDVVFTFRAEVRILP